LELQEIKEPPDVMPELSGMAHLTVALDHVTVPAPDAGSLQEASLGEIGHDPLNRPLCDPDALGDLSETHVGVLRDTQQDLGVVSEERPTMLRGVS
jgi:hypothetical protein